MENLIYEWGTEILFALISAGILGYSKWYVHKLQKEKEQAEKNAQILAEQKADAKIIGHITVELEPIYQELEDLRAYIRETATLEKSHMNLIIASYRFRLIQICKGILSQGYITIAQRTQLDEFYKVYTGLGGNGQAKIYYEQCIMLPTKADE